MSPLFLDSEAGERENARVSHEAASKTSPSRVSFRQPLTRGLPKCRDWIRVESELLAEFHMNSAASSSSDALFFAQRRAQNWSDWWQSARDQEKEKEGRRSAVSPFLSFPPSSVRTFSSKERDLWVRRSEQCLKNISLGVMLLVIASITWQVIQDVF